MQITTIRYEQTFNTGNYENQKIAVEATLAEGDDPAQVLVRLRAFVADQDPALVQARAVVATPEKYRVASSSVHERSVSIVTAGRWGPNLTLQLALMSSGGGTADVERRGAGVVAACLEKTITRDP